MFEADDMVDYFLLFPFGRRCVLEFFQSKSSTVSGDVCIMANWFVPQVFEQSGRGERFYDLYSRLLKDRIVFIQGGLDDATSNIVVGQLLFLESESSKKNIYLYINSMGGSVTAGLAVYDTMQYVRAPVQTLCIGQAVSVSALLLAAGEPGKRFALPHSRVMIHQPLGGATGQATDVEIQANELSRVRGVLNRLFVKHTKSPLEKIEQDTDRNFFMSADQALQYGIVDSIFTKKS